jgi:hypothetical protein
MKKLIIMLLVSVFLLFSYGCANKTQRMPGSYAAKETKNMQALPLPTPPAEIRLGNSYISALGEQCYEAYLSGSPTSQVQAYCHQDEGWVLLPQIYTGVPMGAALSN